MDISHSVHTLLVPCTRHSATSRSVLARPITNPIMDVTVRQSLGTAGPWTLLSLNPYCYRLHHRLPSSLGGQHRADIALTVQNTAPASPIYYLLAAHVALPLWDITTYGISQLPSISSDTAHLSLSYMAVLSRRNSQHLHGSTSQSATGSIVVDIKFIVSNWGALCSGCIVLPYIPIYKCGEWVPAIVSLLRSAHWVSGRKLGHA